MACLLSHSDNSESNVSQKLIWLATWWRWTRPPLRSWVR